MMSERGVGCGISIWDKTESTGALSFLGEEAMPFRRVAPGGGDIEMALSLGVRKLGRRRCSSANFQTRRSIMCYEICKHGSVESLLKFCLCVL